LEHSGAYLGIVHAWPPPASKNLDGWVNDVRKDAEAWLAAIDSLQVGMVPVGVRDAWQTILSHGAIPIKDVALVPDLVAALIRVAIIADEVFSKFAAPGSISCRTYLISHEEMLRPTRVGGATLCADIDPSRIRVLPKSRLITKGMNVRNLTHFLAYCPGGEVEVVWHEVLAEPPSGDMLNMLLVPWPVTIGADQFAPLDPKSRAGCEIAPGYDYFCYSARPIDPKEFGDWFERLLIRAEKKSGPVHFIVFPEASLTVAQYSAILSRLRTRSSVLVAGVCDQFRDRHSTVDAAGSWYRNRSFVSVPLPSGPGLDVPRGAIRQGKHHRWLVTPEQIRMYEGLDAVLNPDMRWWEGIEIEERRLNFIRFANLMTCCVHICEDFTQHHPCGESVLSVAPELVIALLQDAAQLPSRWPGVYASKFADDPGTSVLTMTSSGMVELSYSAAQGRISRSIALWRDGGTRKEIEVRPGNAVVLQLQREAASPRFSADGRRSVDPFRRLAYSRTINVPMPKPHP
jgi:hypothetical protein